VTAEEALREAADLFHKIVSGLASARLIAREGMKMPQNMYDEIAGKILTNEVVEEIAADGFEACVRALAALGAKDVSIHECRESDMVP